MAKDTKTVFQGKFHRTLRENATYADSMKRLTDAGVRKEYLTSLLFQYCDEQGREAMRGTQKFSKFLMKTIENARPNLHLLHK